MRTVQPFIDLGFYVVPIEGKIERGPDGKKTGFTFKNHWKELYLEEPYSPSETEPVAITGAFITGKTSGAISIDCDNQETFDILKALDPESANRLVVRAEAFSLQQHVHLPVYPQTHT